MPPPVFDPERLVRERAESAQAMLEDDQFWTALLEKGRAANYYWSDPAWQKAKREWDTANGAVQTLETQLREAHQLLSAARTAAATIPALHQELNAAFARSREAYARMQAVQNPVNDEPPLDPEGE